MKMGDLNPEEKQVRELVAEEVTGGEEVTAEGGEEVITIQESVLADILGEEISAGDYKKGAGKPGPTPPKVGGGTPVGTVSKETPALEVPLSTKAGGVTKVAPKTAAKFGTKLQPGKDTGAKPPTTKPVAVEEDVENLEEQEDETPKTPKPPSETYPPRKKPYTPENEPSDTPRLFPRQGAMEEQLQAYVHNYAKLYESHQDYEYNYAHLYQEAEQLHEQNEKFRGLLVKTQEKLNEVNVRNAQLHYTNRTLISDSLNERQKDKIVEAIQKSGTVEEAKTIFETLQSAVAGVRYNQTAPKSLNEAINKHSSAFLPRKREEKAHSDPSLVERMQTLAGIKRQTL
jgi:hypothetical protein